MKKCDFSFEAFFDGKARVEICCCAKMKNYLITNDLFIALFRRINSNNFSLQFELITDKLLIGYARSCFCLVRGRRHR